MSRSEGPLQAQALPRALMLGIGVFIGFTIVAGALWALGGALGLGTAPAFFLAACAAPLLVAGPILLWFFAQPLARRQALLGLSPAEESAADDAESE